MPQDRDWWLYQGHREIKGEHETSLLNALR